MENRKLYIQILVVSILCIVLVALAVTFKVFTPPKNSHRVTFRVESSGGIAYITYKDSRNLQKEKIQVSTPWEKTWDNPSGTEVYVTAGNPTQMGSIKCILKIDGKVWKSDTASGQDDSVVCAGIVR
jgi:hypothetical protein